MIICHENIKQIEILISLLDYEYNDIYIHIDKKSKLNSKEDRDKINSCAKKSKISFIKSIRTSWASDSLMKVEINLLREATKEHHAYYHLLSGADLPLKTQEYIHQYLNNDGREYIFLSPDSVANKTKNFLDRFRYYYFLQNMVGRSYGILYHIQNMLVKVQKFFKIDRTVKAEFEYVKGPQWFSITHNTALYIIDNYEKYGKYFIHSLCPDESFAHTIIKNSPVEDNVADGYLRYIDWQRGTPYIFKEEDFEELINSDCFFARKFDMNCDEKIIYRIYDYLVK